MHCPSCGKEIPNLSKFCLYCGENISSPGQNQSMEWEYKDFTWGWSEGNGPTGTLGDFWGEVRVKSEFWNRYQRTFFIDFQKWLDGGWQQITEIGPSSLMVKHIPRGSTKNQNMWELIECRVTTRRPIKTNV